MATRKKYIENTDGPAPRDLTDHPFYGLPLDEDQKAFAEAILNPEKLIVFCDAPAGTGKTTVSMGAANLLVQHHEYEGIIGIVSPCNEGRQGFLPGDITAKSEVYFEPFYQAMVECNMNPQTDVCNDALVNQKNGDGLVTLITDTFLRGSNFHKKVVIIDEAQNFTASNLKKTLTRIADDCKVICIGHLGQNDLDSPEQSGFEQYIEHFRADSRTAVCELRTNHRGWISSHADALQF
ncbi:MAG: PhoH family protein [bacterium]|nr:PhoH family protein [bacterium]